MKEERKLVSFELPVSVIDKLSQTTQKVGGEKKQYQWQIVTKALKAWFTTELDWEESKKFAMLELRVLQRFKEGEANYLTIELEPAAALKLRDSLNEKLAMLGLMETKKNERHQLNW